MIAHLALNGLRLYEFKDQGCLRIKLNLTSQEQAIGVTEGWAVQARCASPEHYLPLPWDDLPPIPTWITRDELQKLINLLEL